MGTGDWNDGMNRVGSEGRGESVWLGWFLCSVVDDFAPIARARGETARVRSAGTPPPWAGAAALLGTAWDGSWFKRAFFDDGSPLGSHVNSECRIDLIAQAWSVMSKVAPTADASHRAGRRWRSLLIDPDAGLVQAAGTRHCSMPSRVPATSRPTRPVCARTAASTRTPASGR